MDENRLRAEALRVYHRYATEVVEPLGLCPWARRARLEGRVTHRVELDPRPSPDGVLPHLDAVAGDPGIDIGLLIFPRLDLDAPGFRRFMAAIRDRDAQRHDGLSPLYMADFHPHARLDATSPARLVAFIRRTPDPTIQLVRRSVLDAVRKNQHSGTVFLSPEAIAAGHLLPAPSPPLHQRIAETNHDTLQQYGFERLGELLDDIRRDRDRAYAAITGDSPRR